MTWVLIIGVTWLAVSVVAALLIAGSIRLADRRRSHPTTTEQGNFVVDLPVASASEQRREVRPARTPAVRNVAPVERPSSPRQTGTR